jgi:branched-subunit amino acid ABC-type transport system permease component
LTDGLLLGFVYGVAAMGLTLIWGVMSVINLAHGPVIALGMFATYLLFTLLGLNPYLALVPVALLGLLLGFVIYGVAVHRVINAPHLSSLLATFAVNMIIIGLGTAIFSTSPKTSISPGFREVGFLTIPSPDPGHRWSALGTTALYLFLYFTRPGKAIRAVANNRKARS